MLCTYTFKDEDLEIPEAELECSQAEIAKGSCGVSTLSSCIYYSLATSTVTTLTNGQLDCNIAIFKLLRYSLVDPSYNSHTTLQP